MPHDRFAAALEPGSSRAWLALGRRLQGLGETVEALRCLRRALALAPDDLSVHETLILALEAEPAGAEALATARRRRDAAAGRQK